MPTFQILLSSSMFLTHRLTRPDQKKDGTQVRCKALLMFMKHAQEKKSNPAPVLDSSSLHRLAHAKAKSRLRSQKAAHSGKMVGVRIQQLLFKLRNPAVLTRTSLIVDGLHTPGGFLSGAKQVQSNNAVFMSQAAAFSDSCSMQSCSWKG